MLGYRVSNFDRKNEKSAWCITAGSSRRDGSCCYPAYIRLTSIYLILFTLDHFCQHGGYCLLCTGGSAQQAPSGACVLDSIP